MKKSIQFLLLLSYLSLSLLLLNIPSTLAHGRLTFPQTRDQVNQIPDYLQNGPVPATPLDQNFVCRGLGAGTPTTTLTAGQPTTLRWMFTANHVGDCAVYLTYDVDAAPTQQRYFKIADLPRCKDQNNINVNITIPSYLPPCQRCVLRWEWIALHVRPTIEYYAQCVDVTITSTANPGQLPAPLVYVPGHLPTAGTSYRVGFPDPPSAGNPCFLVGPALATISGVTNPNVGAFPCTPATGASNVPGGGSPTPSPPTSAPVPAPTTGNTPSPNTPAPTPAPNTGGGGNNTPAPTPAPSTGGGGGSNTPAPTPSPTNSNGQGSNANVDGTATSKNDDNTTVAVAIGLGIPIVLVAVGIIVVLVLQDRQNRLRMKRMEHESRQNNNNSTGSYEKVASPSAAAVSIPMSTINKPAVQTSSPLPVRPTPAVAARPAVPSRPLPTAKPAIPARPVPQRPTISSADSAAAADWGKYTDDAGNVYYYNSKTQVSQWDAPVGVQL